MAFEIPEGLHPDLMGIAWLIGRWEGPGKGTYPGTADFEFGQQIDFAQNGGNYLHYLSQTFEVGEDGKAIRALSMETGFWRPQSDGSIEVVMCHPSGYAEVWYGKITGAKIELATDAVVRTASADDYSAGQRLYGNVEGDLLWTFDKAAQGQPLQTHLWARLKRT
ncbi:MAG: FABP family protein [Propionibacteriaceae bacterium]|nr:FABP family protein [Propionibacteriaceae bacterium]